MLATASLSAQSIPWLHDIAETLRQHDTTTASATVASTPANAAAAIELHPTVEQPETTSEPPAQQATPPVVEPPTQPSVTIKRPEATQSTPVNSRRPTTTIERTTSTSDTITRQPAWYQTGLLPLGIVLAAIGAVAWGMKKFKGTTRINGGDVLSVLTQTHIAPKQSVALVQMGGKLVFVGVTAQSITPIRVIEDREEAATVRTKLRIGGMTTKQNAFDELVRVENDKLVDAMEPDASAEPQTTNGTRQVQKDINGLLDRLRTLRTDATQATSNKK